MSSIKLYHITFYGCHLCLLLIRCFLLSAAYTFLFSKSFIHLQLILLLFGCSSSLRISCTRDDLWSSNAGCYKLQYEKPNVDTNNNNKTNSCRILVSTLRIFNSSLFDLLVISCMRVFRFILLLAVYFARSPFLSIIIICVVLFRSLTLRIRLNSLEPIFLHPRRPDIHYARVCVCVLLIGSQMFWKMPCKRA